MIDQPFPAPRAEPDEPWLERARRASFTLLTRLDRNPHGAVFLTGFPMERMAAQQQHPLSRAG